MPTRRFQVNKVIKVVFKDRRVNNGVSICISNSIPTKHVCTIRREKKSSRQRQRHRRWEKRFEINCFDRLKIILRPVAIAEAPWAPAQMQFSREKIAFVWENIADVVHLTTMDIFEAHCCVESAHCVQLSVLRYVWIVARSADDKN